jgi:hypothetical protein
MPVVSPSILNLERLFHLPCDSKEKLKLFIVRPKPSILLHPRSSKKAYVWHFSSEEAISLALSLTWLDSNENSLTTPQFTSKEITPPTVPCLEDVL